MDRATQTHTLPHEGISEYRAEVRVKNNLLLRAIEDSGFSSVREFCDKYELNYNGVIALIGMRQPAIAKRDGDYRGIVKKIAMLLGVMPEDIVPARAMAGAQKTVVVREFTEEQLDGFLSAPPSPEAIVDQQDRERVISQVLDTLAPRERDILKKRFGLEGEEEHTLEELANVHHVGRERIRQIEARALRKCRHPSRLDLLSEL